MTPASEAALLRRRQADHQWDADHLPPDPPGAVLTMLCQTKSLGSYPTVAQAVYALAPATVTGNETEAATPTLSATTDTLFAVNVGASVPPVGTYVLATMLDRWVFQYG